MTFEVWKDGDADESIVHCENEVARILFEANDGKIKCRYYKEGKEYAWDIRIKDSRMREVFGDLRRMKEEGFFGEDDDFGVGDG